MSLLEVENLRVEYPLRATSIWSRTRRSVKAVSDVSFKLEAGSTLGIVGESGCGKSTLARAVMRLLPLAGGKIELMQRDLATMRAEELRQFRRHFQMVFQDPEASLNPRFTVGELIAEPIRVYEPKVTGEALTQRVATLMTDVGLSPSLVRRYPHEFSGGQRQRISIARAIAVQPVLVVCDEAVSALDVSIQAQILNLLADLRAEHKLTYLFISHDLSVVRHISDRVMVMYLGRVVELGRTEDVVDAPAHPYTRALIKAVPRYGKPSKVELKGEIPSPVSPPSGCVFHTRCPEAVALCRQQVPVPRQVEGRLVACHKFGVAAPA